MQFSGNKPLPLADLPKGERAVIARLNLEPELSKRLMELGFLPGGQVRAGRSAPGGDPKVFEVDGSEIALRRETAAHIHVERHEP